MTTTTLTPFHYGDEQVRTYEEDGQIWFIATDVARILGYRDAEKMTRSLEADEKGTHIVGTLGGAQTLSTITEAGLYHATLVARVEAAKPFRRWVTHEVLPSIRKTGSYNTTPQVSPAAPDAQYLMRLIGMARGLIDPAHLEAKARIVLARAMGEHPEIEAQARPLYVQDYMVERGATRKQARRYAAAFGKYVKQAYAAEHDGAVPGRYPYETASGQVRDVYAYTESDRPLLDRIWNAKYADRIGGQEG